jgi:hypothetical protein
VVERLPVALHGVGELAARVRFNAIMASVSPGAVGPKMVKTAPSVRQPVAILAGGALVMAVGGTMARRQSRQVS